LTAVTARNRFAFFFLANLSLWRGRPTQILTDKETA
jgi:hypothetical protein